MDRVYNMDINDGLKPPILYGNPITLSNLGSRELYSPFAKY